MKNIIQITAGRGPLECMFVVSKVLKIFLKHVKNEGIEFTVLQRNLGPKPETICSVIISLEEKNITEFMKNWQGSILWIGKSPYRKFHKRKNWFIEINVFDALRKTDFNQKEIEFKTTKASGPGGQHVNKTDSAVWATHKKSGIKVFVQDTRSQFQNKKLAIERLQKAIENNEIEQLQNQNFEHWKKTTDIQRGNPIRTFEGMKFKEVK